MDFSLIAGIFQALGLPLPPRLTLLDARTLTTAHVPPFPQDIPALLLHIDSSELSRRLKSILMTVYPPAHRIQWVRDGVADERRLEEFGADEKSGEAALYVAAVEEGTSFESFAELIAHLRAPYGCPWDREQTHESLRKHLLEEAYEAIAAIDSGNFADMREEFGDLLLQVVLQAQIAHEEGHFNIGQVIHGIHAKIVRRHPHVFGDLKLDGVDGVLANWEKLKEKERGAKKEERGLLDGVPKALPALSQAQEYQDRAARVGFDWPEIEGVLEKISEEVEEVRRASDPNEVAAEIGDLLFALVNLARWKKVDAESALRGTNSKFRKRFAYIEQGARDQGRDLTSLSLEEMESLWQEAKGNNS